MSSSPCAATSGVAACAGGRRTASWRWWSRRAGAPSGDGEKTSCSISAQRYGSRRMPRPNGWASESTVIQSRGLAGARRSSCQARSGSSRRTSVERCSNANQRGSSVGLARGGGRRPEEARRPAAPGRRPGSRARRPPVSGQRTPYSATDPRRDRAGSGEVLGIGEARRAPPRAAANASGSPTSSARRRAERLGVRLASATTTRGLAARRSSCGDRPFAGRRSCGRALGRRPTASPDRSGLGRSTDAPRSAPHRGRIVATAAPPVAVARLELALAVVVAREVGRPRRSRGRSPVARRRSAPPCRRPPTRDRTIQPSARMRLADRHRPPEVDRHPGGETPVVLADERPGHDLVEDRGDDAAVGDPVPALEAGRRAPARSSDRRSSTWRSSRRPSAFSCPQAKQLCGRTRTSDRPGPGRTVDGAAADGRGGATQTSRLRTFRASVLMKSLRGSTFSPISIVKIASAIGGVLAVDLEQRPRLRVHRRLPELVGVHLAEALEALDGQVLDVDLLDDPRRAPSPSAA